MFNAHGEIQVPGFLAGISEPNEEDIVLAELSSPSAESIARETGFDPRLMASRTSLAKRRGFLPTLEVNALASENIPSQEIQTIIPAFAQAQLTARLVPGQDPGACLRALEEYIQQTLSPGFRLEIRDKGIGGPGLHLPRTCPATERATRCIEELFSCEPRFAWEGMSIPILPTLLNGFAREAVLCGFGLDDDNTHGPNESFSLEQFKAGFLFVARYLADDAFISSDVNEGLGI
jgi:succinyl-diaminopimelate desuccinylase